MVRFVFTITHNINHDCSRPHATAPDPCASDPRNRQCPPPVICITSALWRVLKRQESALTKILLSFNISTAGCRFDQHQRIVDTWYVCIQRQQCAGISVSLITAASHII